MFLKTKKNVTKILSKKIKNALKKIYSKLTSREAKEKDIEYVKDFYNKYIQTKNNINEISESEILAHFPLFSINSAFKKFQTKEDLLPHE